MSSPSTTQSAASFQQIWSVLLSDVSSAVTTHSLTTAAQTCPIPDPLPYQNVPPNLTLLRRCTLLLSHSYQNARLADLSRNYDLLAVRPVDEPTLSLACTSLDCDLISLDLTQPPPLLVQAQNARRSHPQPGSGSRSAMPRVLCRAEVGVGQGRILISNATQLIRASRGRGLVVSSEAGTCGGV